MVYDFTLERAIFLHSIDNPPHKDLTCSITLNQVNSTDAFQLTKYGGGYQTEYILEIENPLQLGFSNSGDHEIENGMTNLVLAMNLSLTHTCVLPTKIDFGQNNVKYKPLPQKPAAVKQNGNHFTIEVQDTILFTDYVSIGFGMKEDLDEQKVIAIFRNLQNSDRFKITSTSTIVAANTAKALKEFENAMNSLDRLMIFKHLYNAVELAANYDGSKDGGTDLDKKISALTGADESDVKLWRELYNRSKHVDFKTEHVDAFLKGRDQLPQMNVKVRDCAKTMLLARL